MRGHAEIFFVRDNVKDKISKPNWKIIRAFCEQKSASDADAAKHFGVSKDAIRMRRKRENWGNSTRTDHEQSEKNEQSNTLF